jgi:vacuolar-type H+-ATPase subunit F/Vma7
VPLLLLLILMVRCQYFLFHATETTVKQIEDAFKEFTAREDIAIVLISQFVSEPSHRDAYICVLMHC